eukprot:277823-Rhodomonas_salina.1
MSLTVRLTCLLPLPLQTVANRPGQAQAGWLLVLDMAYRRSTSDTLHFGVYPGLGFWFRLLSLDSRSRVSGLGSGIWGLKDIGSGV